MRALRAEWTKQRTLLANGWLVLGVAGLTAGLGAFVTWTVRTSACGAPTACDYDLTRTSLIGVHLGQLAVAVLAALAVTNEYETGLIRTTLAADPRRTVVFAAKAVVVTVATLAAGLLGVAGAVLAARSILPGNGFTAANGYLPLPLDDGSTLRAAGGTVLYLGLIGLLSLGVGHAVRRTAPALAIVLGALYGVPLVAQFVTDPDVQRLMMKYSPMTAGLAIQSTEGVAALPIGPWPGLGLLAAYAAGAVLLGAVLFVLRDA